MPTSLSQPKRVVLRSCSELEALFDKADLPDSTIILLDIDDTVIVPVSKTLRDPKHRKLIDNIKQNKDKYPNYTEILSNWRLQRKVQLVDPKWPDLIERLKQRYEVYGLTKLDTGQFGNIESMEKWRYQELKELGVLFSQKQLGNTIVSSVEPSEEPLEIDGASYYKGIIFTGLNSKSATLTKFKNYFIIDKSISGLVMLDDRSENLDDVATFAANHQLSYLAVQFNGVLELAEHADPRVVEIQQSVLFSEARWLEDSMATKLLEEQKYIIN